MANLNGHEGGNAGNGQGAPKGPGEGDDAVCGGDGGKGAGQGECGPTKHAPGAGPGRRAQCVGPHKASSEDGQGETVHHAPAPRLRHRDPARGVLQPQAGSGTWSRRRNVADVRRAAGGATSRISLTRLRRGAYRAKPVRRVFIPKPDGRQRPLGVTTLEDKVVQRALVRVLNCIYEVDFLGFSYGFRPGRKPHDALDALCVGIETEEGELGARCRHSWLLRRHRPRIAGEVHRAPR